MCNKNKYYGEETAAPYRRLVSLDSRALGRGTCKKQQRKRTAGLVCFLGHALKTPLQKESVMINALFCKLEHCSTF